MKKSTTLIYCPVGAYGTFFEWCLRYFTDPDFDQKLSVSSTGNSHSYTGHLFTLPIEFEGYLRSTFTIPFARIHPGATSVDNSLLFQTPQSFDKLLDIELQMLSEIVESIIVLYISTRSQIWGLNNFLTKVNLLNDGLSKDQITDYTKLIINDAAERPGSDPQFLMASPEEKIKYFISGYDKNIVNQWNVSSMDDLAIWQLRELLSMSLPKTLLDSCDDRIYTDSKAKFPHIKFIEISELRDNFSNTILDTVSHLGLSAIRQNELDTWYNNWIKKQFYAYRDYEVDIIVDNLRQNQDYDWSDKNISLADEVFIQHLLRQSGIEIACYGLDKFPTNTKDFETYLIR